MNVPLLLAAPRQVIIEQVPQAQEQNGLYLLVFAAALPGLVMLIVQFVQWLGKRAVDREDKDKEEVRHRVETLEKEMSEIRSGARLLQVEVSQTLKAIEGVRGIVTEMKLDTEKHLREMSSEFAEKLEKLEYDMRQQMSRAIADQMSQRKRRG